ncbi:MAG: hypothetical protein ACXQT2_00510 [Methanotrichaceae archaeon]
MEDVIIKMHEKDLYPAVEQFLKTQKNCPSEYVGTELSLKRGDKSLRADVFGVSNKGEKTIYLCEGKKELKYRSFDKVVGEAVELFKYADYVYVFGSLERFEREDLEDQISKCERLGIGILSVNINEEGSVVKELLKARRNKVEKQDKKEVLLRVFIKDTEKPISNIIFQAAFEYINLNRDIEVKTPCVRYIDVFNSIFSDEEFKERVRRVIGHHTLTDRDVRAEFQRRYSSSPYIRIERKADILDDTICFTEEGLRKGKSPILLN